ncbi:MAG: AmmeMemoRadiSam system protein B [Candidatus Omnitrophica bacterium]|nr:AmmeMemoRadiSam system protein B [Candidatus Omnitrophota bacterium]
MKKIFTVAIMLFLLSCSIVFSEEVRKAAVAGAFYPIDKDQLAKKVDQFLSNAGKPVIKGDIVAIVVPHAGYDYSGQVAAYAFKEIKNKKFKKIIIISPSHYAGFDGISVYNKGFFETPLGLVKIDEALADRIMQKSSRFLFYPAAHEREHAIEVELPFLQRIYEDFTIVPITMGRPILDDVQILLSSLYDVMDKETLLIMSVDLSHYYTYEEAVEMDTRAISAIKDLDAELLLHQLKAGNVELDAPIAVLATMMLADKFNATGEILKYANSGDVSGDKTRVVGYSSIVMYVPEGSSARGDRKEKGDMTMKDEYLNKKEKQKLLEIAKASIREAVMGKAQAFPEVTEARLKENCGAFVTIKKHGQLRGCIGYIMAVKPLSETVKDVARSAAIGDPRFAPMTEDELKDMEIEVSALTPLKRISDAKEIEVGKHGLYMKRGFYSGLLLPQVATEYGWDRETFLQHTCAKAGLPTDAWKDPSTEIYTFSADVFGEEKPK